jgi:hypothetical protein
MERIRLQELFLPISPLCLLLNCYVDAPPWARSDSKEINWTQVTRSHPQPLNRQLQILPLADTSWPVAFFSLILDSHRPLIHPAKWKSLSVEHL